MRRQLAHGYFYLLSDDHATHTKLGISSEMGHRMSTYKTGNPYNPRFILVQFIGTMKEARAYEEEVKKKFAMKGEWIEMRPEVFVHRLGAVPGYAVSIETLRRSQR